MGKSRKARPEPIRVVSTEKGDRYRVVVDVSGPGEPRKQRTRTFDNLEGARDWLTETRRQVKAGTYGHNEAAQLRRDAARAFTVADVAKAWIASLDDSDVRPITVRGYESALRPVLDRIGSRPVVGLTPTDVKAALTWVRDHGSLRPKGGPLSNGSVRYARLSLRLALGYAVEHGIITENPARDVKPPKRKGERRREVAVWTPAQLRSFVAAGDRDPLAVAWRLVACGLRRSEVCGLSWSSVDLDAGTIQVEASRVAAPGGRTEADAVKSDNSARTVPVETIWPGTTVMLRAAYLAAGRPETGPVVVNEAGSPVHPDALTSRFRALTESAGLPVVRMHATRHTLGTILHDRGVPPRHGAALLGHSLPVHLSVYVPKAEDGATVAAGALAEALAAEGTA